MSGQYREDEIVQAFHLMWDSYPEQVRLIDKRCRVMAEKAEQQKEQA